MDFSPLLDTAIGLTFIFLVFSLLASGIHEFAARLLETRAKQLWRSLSRLLEGDRTTDLGKGERLWQIVGGLNGTNDHRPELQAVAAVETAGTPNTITTTALLAHPLIAGLDGGSKLSTATKRTRLSHIDPETFGRALVDMLEPGSDLTDATAYHELKTKLDGQPFGAEIIALVNSGADTAEKLRDNVADWFDTRMQALSRAYRRRTRWWLFAIAIAVAVGMNVDSVRIVDTLYNDDVARAEVVAVAERCLDKAELDPGDSLEVGDCKVEEFRLPVWWGGDDDTNAWPLIGWVISAAAIAQGGPFWFDVSRRLAGFKKAAVGG